VAVADAFYRVGHHLSQLKEEFACLPANERKALGNWSGYCKREFGFNKSYTNMLISGATVYENIKSTTMVATFPTNERQVRPLTKLNQDNPDAQVEIWTDRSTFSKLRVASAPLNQTQPGQPRRL